jgi:hypothetical protein
LPGITYRCIERQRLKPGYRSAERTISRKQSVAFPIMLHLDEIPRLYQRTEGIWNLVSNQEEENTLFIKLLFFRPGQGKEDKVSKIKQIHDTFEKGEGILRLVPNFVPRRFGQAGRRLRLHPDDYYALGTQRGSIKERWFSSVIPAMNGELAPEDEGMSYVAPSDNMENKFLFRDAVEELGADLIGKELHEKYGTWPMYSKLFDYETPLFHPSSPG